jgi:hypothetical protein
MDKKSSRPTKHPSCHKANCMNHHLIGAELHHHHHVTQSSHSINAIGAELETVESATHPIKPQAVLPGKQATATTSHHPGAHTLIAVQLLIDQPFYACNTNSAGCTSAPCLVTTWRGPIGSLQAATCKCTCHANAAQPWHPGHASHANCHVWSPTLY